MLSGFLLEVNVGKKSLHASRCGVGPEQLQWFALGVCRDETLEAFKCGGYDLFLMLKCTLYKEPLIP